MDLRLLDRGYSVLPDIRVHQIGCVRGRPTRVPEPVQILIGRPPLEDVDPIRLDRVGGLHEAVTPRGRASLPSHVIDRGEKALPLSRGDPQMSSNDDHLVTTCPVDASTTI